MHPGIPLISVRTFHLVTCRRKSRAVLLSTFDSARPSRTFTLNVHVTNYTPFTRLCLKITQYLHVHNNVFPICGFRCNCKQNYLISALLQNYTTYLNYARWADDIWRMHINVIDPSFRRAHNSQVDWHIETIYIIPNFYSLSYGIYAKFFTL